MPPEVPDTEISRLLAEYGMVTRLYSWAVSELSRQRGLLPRDEYVKLFRVAEDALADCERVRSELEEFGKKNGHST